MTVGVNRSLRYRPRPPAYSTSSTSGARWTLTRQVAVAAVLARTLKRSRHSLDPRADSGQRRRAEPTLYWQLRGTRIDGRIAREQATRRRRGHGLHGLARVPGSCCRRCSASCPMGQAGLTGPSVVGWNSSRAATPERPTNPKMSHAAIVEGRRAAAPNLGSFTRRCCRVARCAFCCLAIPELARQSWRRC